METPVELGILSLSDLQTSLDTGRKVTAAQRISQTVEYAVLGERLGFDVFALGEHHRACCRTFAAAELVIGRDGPVAGCGSLVAARVTCSGVLRAPGTRPARRERPVPGIPDWPGDMRAVDGGGRVPVRGGWGAF